MKRAAIAGLAAGLAMTVGGALGAVSKFNDLPNLKTDQSDQLETANPLIAGQAMLSDRDIMENMSASPLHTSLVKALKETGVAGALNTNGQFTVFAPTNAAFAAEGSNPKSGLARRLSYLIVPGRYDSQALLRAISEAGGDAKLRTAEGGTLVARMNGPTNIVLMDEKGNTADIAIYDVHDKNGIVHVVDRVLEPSGSPRELASN
jgi:uncharacterized surface protein with fasciclin (FAS1) repeats